MKNNKRRNTFPENKFTASQLTLLSKVLSCHLQHRTGDKLYIERYILKQTQDYKIWDKI